MTTAGSSDEGLVRYTREGRVAWITLNRPDKLNAFTDQMVRDLESTLRRFDLDDEARVAVLTGAGRAFSSGADVKERQARSPEEMAKLPSPEAWDADSTQLMTRSVNWKPVVAAVRGYALGMAMGLAMECELIVAAEDARFQVTETARGLAAARYWAQLAWRCGEGFATKVALTSAFVSAQEAKAVSLVQECVPADELEMAASRVAEQFAAIPPLAARALVRARRRRIRDINEWARYDSELHRLHLSRDFGASVGSFLQEHGSTARTDASLPRDGSG